MVTDVSIGQARADVFGAVVYIVGRHDDGAWLVLAPQRSPNLIPDRWPAVDGERAAEVR